MCLIKLSTIIYKIPKNIAISFTIAAQIHAIAHCSNATPTAHFPPSSCLTAAIAAAHGVYNRQNIRRAAAVDGLMTACSAAVVPKSTVKVDTTLSFAKNPVTSAVQILQSPNPSGTNSGATSPDTAAKILSSVFVTMLK